MNIGELLFGNADTPTRVQGTLDGIEVDIAVNTVQQGDDPYGGVDPDETAPPVVVEGKVKTAPAEEKPVYKTYEDFDYEELLTYAGIDTYATSTVVSRLFPQLIEKPEYKVSISPGQTKTTRAPALIDIYEECTQTIFDFICDLELAGINYDVEANRQLDKSMREEVAFLEDRIFSSVGGKVHLDSADVLGKLLYGTMGLTAPHQTKSGSDSTDGSALLILAGIDPLSPGKYVTSDPAMQYLADIAKRKAIVSVHRGFISTYIDDYVQADGRVHALYNQFGTSTFRLSSSFPNLQNTPRAFGVKRCFNAKPGNVFICFDFSSAEVKCLTSICRDPNMLKAVNEGLDFHSFSASGMYGIPYEVFHAIIENKSHHLHKDYKEKRQTAKTLTFSLLYGSSVGGIAMQLNLSVEDAQRLMTLYFDTFPGVKTYIEQTHAAALHNRFVTTPFGHRRQFYGADPIFKGTAAYNASLRGSQNYVIQSATSVIGAVVFAEINREVKKLGGLCTATVHDSLEAEVPLEKASEAIELFFYYMNDWPQQRFKWLGLSIGADGEVGLDWAGLEHIHRGITQAEVEALINKQRGQHKQ